VQGIVPWGPPMADQSLNSALTWNIAGSLFLQVAGAFWLPRQAYRAARAGLLWCWRRYAHVRLAPTVLVDLGTPGGAASLDRCHGRHDGVEVGVIDIGPRR
jgi:hypothetical protein